MFDPKRIIWNVVGTGTSAPVLERQWYRTINYPNAQQPALYLSFYPAKNCEITAQPGRTNNTPYSHFLLGFNLDHGS